MHRSLIGFRRKHSLRPMNPDAMHCLQPRERMHALVHRERARSDRSTQPFTLVLFRIPGCSGSDRAMLRLANTALRRSRITDDVGWFDGRTLAALLPDTHTEGAWCYANSVKELMAASHQRVVDVTVYTYPTNWTRKVEEGGEASDVTGGGDRRAGGRGRRAPAVAGVAEVGQDVPVVARARDARGETGTGASAAMEDLFVRPMPIGKRIFDIVATSLIVLMISPLLVLAALAVWLSSPGPIIFRQKRAGLGGKPFTMYKFRSMYADAEARMAELRKLNEADGPVFKMKNDPRITPIGRFIRKTSIDELPQLFNVLLGNMSLVGPRPPIIAETKEYETWQHRRLEVTPGITCIWQVSGRSNISFEQWMRMDVQYSHITSISADVKILLKTIPAVFFGRGAH